jgi:Flp pilus assembly protein TadD
MSSQLSIMTAKKSVTTTILTGFLIATLTACSAGPTTSSAGIERAVSVLCGADSAERSEAQNAFSQRGILGVGFEALQRGNTACAERLFSQANRQDPKDPWALLNLGVAQQRLGLLDKARISYQSAAAQDPVTSGAKTAAAKPGQEPETAAASSSGQALKSSPGQIALQNLKLLP